MRIYHEASMDLVKGHPLNYLSTKYTNTTSIISIRN